MGALLFAVIAGYWLMKGLNALAEQAATEVSRYREEFTTLRKDARETVDRGTRAGMSAAGAAQAAWRGMKGAPRGACARAGKIADGTGPVRRVARAGWEGGKMGAAAARQAAASAREARRSARRPSADGGTAHGNGSARRRRTKVPSFGNCGDCGMPTVLARLTKLKNGRRVCPECLADQPVPQQGAPQPSAAPDPESRAWDAVIVPDPALPAPAPAALPQAPAAPPAFTPPAARPVPVPAAQTAAPAAVQARGAIPASTTGEPMTTPGNHLAVPANHLAGRQGSPITPGGESAGESHNHGLWLAACDAQQQRAARLIDQQHAMLANLHSVNGREQVTAITEWAGRARLYAVAVARMVAVVNPGEQRLIGAISNAGGPQNIPDMTYFEA